MTSASSCVALFVNKHTLPPSPILLTTAFGTTEPATKLRFDANGRSDPHGYTVTNPALFASTTVTFNTTAAAPPGTPPRPVTCNSVTEPAARSPPPSNKPSTVDKPAPTRVSNNRAGNNAAYDEPAGGGGGGGGGGGVPLGTICTMPDAAENPPTLPARSRALAANR